MRSPAAKAAGAAQRASSTDTVSPTFDSFYLANIERLAQSLTATLGCPLKAQDAAQEAMLKAYKRWDKVGAYSNPMGWCYRVAINQGRTSWRKSSREDLTASIAMQPTTDVVESLDADLVEALLKLPMEQRAVVVVRVFFGWSLAETAEALGIASGTVSSRYSRAMDVLRRRVASTRPEFAESPQESRGLVNADDGRREARS